jgi:alpha,alpha-trehalase
MSGRSSTDGRAGCPERYPPISTYAIVGDCHTAALISRDGSVDWYCPARFDAPAVFCRLLDADKGGYLRLAPVGAFSAERRYLGRTNLLETTFRGAGGQVRVTDFMPIHHRMAERQGYDAGTSHRLVRLVEGLDGETELEVRFKPTFDYARAVAELSTTPDGGAVARAGGEYLVLACPGVALTSDGPGTLRGRLRLRAGERRWLVLSNPGDADEVSKALESANCAEEVSFTHEYWQRWAARCTYEGPYRDQVLRSALVLKLLTYEPTGAIIAAPTTSLPEQIGGERNWDYRYTWLRDSALILFSLMKVGFRKEAARFFEWLDRTCGSASNSSLQIMYAVDGSRDLPEETLDHLEGYRCSRPVRIGNAAAGQRQLDIYGAVLRAAHLYYCHGTAVPETVVSRRPSPETWPLLRALVEQAAEQWEQSDRGIWEVRGEPQHFVHSKLMCWAAVDRGIRIAREHGLDAPLEDWRRTREAIRRAIYERGYDATRGSFTQAFGSSAVDASALALLRIGFLPATDPRIKSTIERIRTELADKEHVFRYCTDDGLSGGESTFAMCSFWLVDALALTGHLDEAHDLFERLVGYANDLGLLSEEIDPDSGELLGNFPQGFTHLALIRSAVNLAKMARQGAEEPTALAPGANRARAAGQHAAG